MMVKNGVSTLARAINPLAGIADEVCLHDTGSTDGTVEYMEKLCNRLDIVLRYHRTTPESDPKRFFIDGQESFRHVIHAWQSSWTYKPMLADWAWGVNVAGDLASGDYVLRLDADDVVLDPQDIRPTCNMLDTRMDVDIVASIYEIVDPATGRLEWKYIRDRIWRNAGLSHTRVLHEHLIPKDTNWLMAASGLRVRDMRDSKGDAVRIYGRNAKTLLREYESLLSYAKEDDIDADFLHTLGHEMIPFAPKLSIRLLKKALGNIAHYDAEILYQLGRAYEEDGQPQMAIARYGESIAISPTANALLRRGRLTDSKSEIREGKAHAKRSGYMNVDLKLLESLPDVSPADTSARQEHVINFILNTLKTAGVQCVRESNRMKAVSGESWDEIVVDKKGYPVISDSSEISHKGHAEIVSRVIAMAKKL